MTIIIIIIIIVIIIKNKKEKTRTLLDMAIPADRNVVQKEAENNLKYKCLGTEIQRIVDPEMYDYTSNNWSRWNSNEKIKEKFGSYTRKTLDRYTKKHQNITHNTESTAV